ncbi:hypothetical protein [Alkalicoccobacillus gibsonii]|uniref:hypothetical protein n=1 Tax=Alkalicoccobacillus gibsonii TaxID=79881 RepID=UPI001AED9187|nr:hypothetical protein [Alkalicoccobacillus gibsonii]
MANDSIVESFAIFQLYFIFVSASSFWEKSATTPVAAAEAPTQFISSCKMNAYVSQSGRDGRPTPEGEKGKVEMTLA